MIAAFIDGYGSDQVLRVGDFPAPKTGPSDNLVRVHAASVNPVDFKLRWQIASFEALSIPPHF